MRKLNFKNYMVLASIASLVIIFSCRKPESMPVNSSYSAEPVLPETPYDYVASSNDEAAALGRVLFYDKNLSKNNSVACASCHQQSKAFCDNLKFSTGLNDGKTARNTPSVFGKFGRMFWDGRANGVFDLVLRPVKNHVEMDFSDLNALAKKIKGISYYPPLFQKAFPGMEIDSNSIKSALAEFVSNFRFSDNKFSKSKNNPQALSANELIGKNIFFGDGNCSKCHHIEDPNPGGNGYGSTSQPFNIGLDEVYADKGFGNVSKMQEDDGKFMVPVLLNVEFTAPYMHDGRYATLEEVVEHYNSGIQNHPNLDPRLREIGELNKLEDFELFTTLDKNGNFVLDASELAPYPPRQMNLTDAEKKGLVAFLKTLSDPAIFTDKKFSNPFRK